MVAAVGLLLLAIVTLVVRVLPSWAGLAMITGNPFVAIILGPLLGIPWAFRRALHLARFEVLGPSHAEFEGEARERLPRGIAAEPRPSLFRDPGGGLYPRLPSREDVPIFREKGVFVPRFHCPILAQGASPGGPVPPRRDCAPLDHLQLHPRPLAQQGAEPQPRRLAVSGSTRRI